MVIINEIKDEPCELFFYDQLVGIIYDEKQLLDVRQQIKNQELEGYYLILKSKNIRIDINSKRGLDDYPPGFFDTYDKQLKKFLGW